MTDHEGKSFKDKHGKGMEMDETIRDAALGYAKNDELPCALAFKIVKTLGVSPREVGITIDLLNLRLTKCQMGLFGYKPNKKIASPLPDVPPALKDRINTTLTDQKLSCEAAWGIAASLEISKMTVSNACEALGIKMKPCQLGAF